MVQCTSWIALKNSSYVGNSNFVLQNVERVKRNSGYVGDTNSVLQNVLKEKDKVISECERIFLHIQFNNIYVILISNQYIK
jgi:hypothetical protein